MAIVTAVNRPRGQTRGGMRAVLRYVMKEEKTADQGRHLVTGVNCQAASCCDEFISTKLQYGKDGSRMYYHFVQSFHPEEAVTPELAHRIALELAQQWKGYEDVYKRQVPGRPRRRGPPAAMQLRDLHSRIACTLPERWTE